MAVLQDRQHGTSRNPLRAIAFATGVGLGSLSAMHSLSADTATTNAIPTLAIDTALGQIVVELDRRAAPATVDSLVALLETPPESGDGGLFDSTTISYTNPHVEIRIKAPAAAGDFVIPKEINASALGLDDDLVADIDQATDLWDGKILKFWRNELKKQPGTPQLQAWRQQWEQDKSAAFLIGVSKADILEALGHEYVSDVASQPVVRGSVMLKPATLNQSGPVITIALADMPGRNGDWTVIGHVSQGLELAKAISIRPSSERRKPRWVPVDPVEVRHINVQWREIGG